MLLPLKWLRELVAVDATAEELAERLTMAGIEVEGVEARHEGLEKVVVARALAIRPHPNADRLVLVDVDAGAETLTIVCGAPNLKEGMLYPLALPGAEVAGRKVGVAEIRGVKSPGMLCSERELGLGEDHSGIMTLPQGLTPGVPITEALGLETEVLEVAITPNRGDCLSVLGLAREIAALYGLKLSHPPTAAPEGPQPVQELARVDIADPQGCPRYVARVVKGVEIRPSLLWMRERLMACGMRPINNIVDITNYILLEMGQPLHAFDYEQLKGGRIVVRTAHQGERFTTLDGAERQLGEGDLLICDGQRPVALAGIMGGLNSEITDATTTVLIESACFNPRYIRRTSKRLGLTTESSYRFERGIDILATPLAADRAARLMAELADGEVCRGAIDAYPRPWEAPEIGFSLERVRRLLGMEVSSKEARSILTGLGMEVKGRGRQWVVRPPSWRGDISREVDLAEEIARIKGYDQIPDTIPLAPMNTSAPSPRLGLRARVRELLGAVGLAETISYSFVAPTPLKTLDPGAEPIAIANPLSEEMSLLRTTLLVGLVEAAGRNLSRGVEDVGLFELGKVFLPSRGQLPEEPERVGIVMAGRPGPVSWWAPKARVSFAHIKGAVEYLLEGLGLGEPRLSSPSGRQCFVPEISAVVELGGRRIGEVGLIKPEVLEASFDIKRAVYAAELDLEAIEALGRGPAEFLALPRYPAIVRDIAIIVQEGVPAGEVLGAARDAGEQWLERVELFDVYKGKPLPKGTKSLGLRFTYRSSERTLTEQELNPRHEALVQRLLKRFNATLRTT